MEKLRMTSPDLTEANIAKIAELFPAVVTETADDEGRIKKAIDFDMLRQELSDHIVEGAQERYQLDWPGKRAASFAANAPVSMTLRPEREKSQNFDNTKNVFIEGDNLDVLKLLQESYLGTIDLIYIDPPYNTGSDLVYEDNFSETTFEFLTRSQQVDANGMRLVSNSASNGRFHSDWLSMMYPRLKLARALLSDRGLIAISIDANELANLISIGTEVFGPKSNIGTIAVVNNLKGRSDDAHFATAHEYLVVFARDVTQAKVNGFAPDAAYLSEFKFSDEISRYKEVGLKKTGKNSRRADRPNLFYPIFYFPEQNTFSLVDGAGAEKILPIDSNGAEGTWRWGKETFVANCSTELTARVVNGRWNVYVKMRDLVDGKPRTVRPKSVWIDPKYDTGGGKRGIQALFDGKAVFDNPKPLPFLRDVLAALTNRDSLVMDFFAGSGSFAHAMLEANAHDDGSRHYIVVQLPEPPAAGSEAELEGFVSLSEVARERIRRAGVQILESVGLTGTNIDVGFRALTLDSTNMLDVTSSAGDLAQPDLVTMVDSVKPDRTSEDLLFQVLLDWGLSLSVNIEREIVDGIEIFRIESDAVVACFAPLVPASLIDHIAHMQPMRAVFKDSAFTTDASRINAEQIFREVSPETEVRTV